MLLDTGGDVCFGDSEPIKDSPSLAELQLGFTEFTLFLCSQRDLKYFLVFGRSVALRRRHQPFSVPREEAHREDVPVKAMGRNRSTLDLASAFGARVLEGQRAFRMFSAEELQQWARTCPQTPGGPGGW